MKAEMMDPLRGMIAMRDGLASVYLAGLQRMYAPPGRPPATPLPFDIEDLPGEIRVRASLPDVLLENIQVTLTGQTLEVHARTVYSPQAIGGRLILHERPVGVQTRTIPIPAPVDGDLATASYSLGVLTLHLPKKPEAMPKYIHVTYVPPVTPTVMVVPTEPPAVVVAPSPNE